MFFLGEDSHASSVLVLRTGLEPRPSVFTGQREEDSRMDMVSNPAKRLTIVIFFSPPSLGSLRFSLELHEGQFFPVECHYV